mgnify:CR=1 FL=1
MFRFCSNCRVWNLTPSPPSASGVTLTCRAAEVIRESGHWRGGAGARNGDIVSTNRESRTGAAGGHTARTAYGIILPYENPNARLLKVAY